MSVNKAAVETLEMINVKKWKRRDQKAHMSGK